MHLQKRSNGNFAGDLKWAAACRNLTMNELETVIAVSKALNSMNIPYMLVGSLSSSAYGIERSTKDADFVATRVPGTFNARTAGEDAGIDSADARMRRGNCQQKLASVMRKSGAGLAF